MFKFLHTADIHLDSALRRLDRYEGAPVDAIRGATRRALENLVQLAIDESVAFVLVAGDLFDGDWPDFHTGLFFVHQMARLREAGIPVFLIAGNHDAASKITKKLRPPDNVYTFSHRRPETRRLEDLGVAIHGQSFARAAVTENLAAGYPAAVPGMFNVGLLHTSATGREGHEHYAPCSLDDLHSKDYDYWALGHVHQREVLCDEPPVVFCGNLQGRHIGETGPKGCTLVTVADHGRPKVEPRYVDVFRWEVCRVDAGEARTSAELLDRCRTRLSELLSGSDDLPLAVRLEIAGACRAHQQVAAAPRQWTAEVRAAALDLAPGGIWIEKVKLGTSLPADLDQVGASDGPLGELIELIAELKSDPALVEGLLGADLAALSKKLPPELAEGPDAVVLGRPELLHEALDQVEQMLVRQLLARVDQG